MSMASSPAGPATRGAPSDASTDSATSKIPGSREAPPVRTMPARQASNMPLWRNMSRIISNSSRARGSRISATSRLRKQARRTIAHRRHFDFVAFRNQRDDRVAVNFLDLLGFRERRAQSDGQVAGEVVAADGNHSGVSDGALLEDDQFGRARADVGEADAEFALVVAKHGIGGGQRFVTRCRRRELRLC